MGCAWGSNSNHRVAPDKAPIVHVTTTESSGIPPVQPVENTTIYPLGSNPSEDEERLTSSSSREVEIVRSSNDCCRPATPPSSPPRSLKSKSIKFVDTGVQTIDQIEKVDTSTQIEEQPRQTSPFATRSFSTSNNQATSIQDCLEGKPGTLEAAFQKFDDDDRDIFAKQIQEAKENCNRSFTHGLVMDESAALYLYSMRNDGENSVYNRLNRTLESGEQLNIDKWIKYLTLLRSAWEKLPLVPNEVWQGIPYDEELVEKLSSSSVDELFTCIGSCTPLPKVIKELFENSNQSNGKILMFGYEGVGAKDITPYIEGNHREVMLWPGKRINRVTFNEGTVGNSSCITVHLSYEPEQLHIQIVGEDSHQTTPRSTTRAKTESSRTITSTLPSISEESTIPPVLPAPISPRTGHFICPNKICVNACDGWHSGTHCRGIAHLNHYCNHHCGAGYRCYLCKKHNAKLYECTSCHWRFCELCSFQ